MRRGLDLFRPADHWTGGDGRGRFRLSPLWFVVLYLG
jgi:hypothetical protein